MAFSLFGKLGGAKSVLGLDIGTASIKLVELARSSGRFELVNYGIFELADLGGAIETNQKNVQLQSDGIVAGIKELVKRVNVGSHKVVAAIPAFSTFATVLSMPYLSEKDLAKAIPIEAKKHIPIPIEEVDIDWTIIGTKPALPLPPPTLGMPSVSVKAPIVDVFLVAIAQAEKNKYKDIIRGAGLELVSFDLESIGLIRSIIGNDLSPMALVNIGGRSTTILIIDRGYEQISHNYEVGGFEITRSIARSMGVDLARAEQLKRSVGLKKDGTKVVSEAMLSLIDMIIFETQKTITTYERDKSTKLQKIFLVGGIANMPGFLEYFKTKTQLDATIGNPFARVNYNQKLAPIINDLAPSLAVATGVAMRTVEI